MIATQLIEQVVSVIQDTSFNEDAILAKLNQGMLETASLVSLPDLAVTDTVNTLTDANYVSLPQEYQRDIYMVVSLLDERRVDVPGHLYDYMGWKRKHPVISLGAAAVLSVAVRGRRLYYYPTPSEAETLQLDFYRFPVDMDAAGSPDGLPVEFHAQVLTNYACAEIFTLIEDGIEGPKVNTDHHRNLYMGALSSLAHSLKDQSADEPEYASDSFWGEL